MYFEKIVRNVKKTRFVCVMGKLKRTIKLARFCPQKNEGCSTIYDKIGAAL